MNIKELITRLQTFDEELEVAILDGFNGGGEPRTINLGPSLRSNANAFTKLDYSDLDSDEDQTIVVMGYGCY